MTIDDVTLARALHVLAVMHWIGGVGFVTLVILPLAASRSSANDGLTLFEAVEHRFAAQIRLSIPLAGATGLWMTWRLDLWDRFADPAYWWMAAMAGLWLAFMLMIFVLEPALHDRFARQARIDPATAFRRMGCLHALALVIATLTALGAVVGTHGVIF